ncbi:glycosyltransferase family 9 protein [Helicobacter pylori]|uniref:glycosyltransferase family 9 protein n=1 Tax=Helicobacter pylori TaxID=210 RepID=UPI001F196ABE|nr:glycosyltransferase family 9 protein [Helicobacter pylori]
MTQRLIDKLLSITPIKRQNATEKALCIVRLDVVGDYILTRNFFAPFKEHYKDYKIVFISNSILKDLSVIADSPYIDEFIFLDHSAWNQYNGYQHTFKFLRYWFKFFIKRYNELLMLKKTHYEIAISPILPYGIFLRDDIVMKHLNASVKLAVRYEPYKDRGHFDFYETDKQRWHFYTHLFNIPKASKFLFESNQELFSAFFKTFKGVDLDPVPFGMELPPSSTLKESSQNLLNSLSSRYGVLNLGASESFRCYRYFNRIVRYLNEDIQLVICGTTPDEAREASKLVKAHKNAISLVGKTSLLEYAYIIKGAEFALGNESNIAHLAAALKVPYIFILSSGSSYVTFHPYPKTLCATQHMIYPLEFASIRESDKIWEYRDVNTIKPSAVIASIKDNAPHLLKENTPYDIDKDYFIEEA